MPKSQKNNIVRIIDANINRAKEGLRVSEEIARFLIASRSLTAQLKTARHRIDDLAVSLASKVRLLSSRNSPADIGRTLHKYEIKRRDSRDIFFANIQRVKESLRVLEEFSKLDHATTALQFKKLRYSIYETEKKIARRFGSLCGR
ncbi:thiamine-phosphate pyrophosphorylase [Candidatus Omnitrophota bacterium]